MSDKKIQNLFSAIARYYDFLNALLSLRRDRSWRRETVKASDVEPTSKVLDVCTGTGELALAYRDKISAEGFVIGSDFCFEMLVIGDRKVKGKNRYATPLAPLSGAQVREPALQTFLAADTLTLPFLDDTFDIVSVGFGIRNVSDLEMGIREMTRVAVPGGRVVILEFTQPVNPLFRGLYYFYFTKILPFIGNPYFWERGRCVWVSPPFCDEVPELRCFERCYGAVRIDRCAVLSKDVWYCCDSCWEEVPCRAIVKYIYRSR